MSDIRRALRLARASWNVVRGDCGLLALPAMSALAVIAVVAVCFVPAGLLAGSTHSKGSFLVASAAAVYPLTFVAVLFRFAFVVVVSDRLDGRTASVRDGLELAWHRRDSIARSLVVAAAAGLIRGLRQLPLLGGLAGWIASTVLGIAWSAVTFFVVPVLAVEGKSGRRAIDRSASLFRERWGLEVAGVASISIFVVLVALLGLVGVTVAVAVIHKSVVAVAALLVAAIVGLLALMLAGAAVHQAFALVLYRYATGRPLPAGFSESDMRASVRPMRRRRL